jgi:hypothetical protein
MPLKLLLLLLLTCACAQGQVFAPGTSLESVQSELGPAESIVEAGAKEILVYADGTRLEFMDGKLIRPDQLTLLPAKPVATDSLTRSDPLIKAEHIVAQREKQTISTNVGTNDLDYSKLAESYGNRKTFEGLEADLRAEEASSSWKHAAHTNQRLKEIALGFAIELLVTFVVLSIAFQLSGLAPGYSKLILLSTAVALIGALLDTLLHTGPLHPIRSVAGFSLLLVLIPQLTHVRKWATALKIAAIARIVSILFFWLVLKGLSGLLTI